MGFSKVLVIDTSVKQFLENRVFDPAYARQFPGALALAKLREFGRPRGFEVVTADVYRRRGCRQHQIVVGLSDETGNVCSKMIRRGLWAGGILMSLESPIVALRFYHLLERKAVGYQYAVLYQGAHRRLPSLVQPRTVYFPGVLITERNDVEWSRRELLVMVASNKMAPHSRRMSFDARDPLTSSARVIRRLCLQYIVKRDPMLRLADLYAHRLSAAAYFAEKGDLHLYGRYWDQPISHVSARAAVSVRSCWRGTVPNKIEVMRNFRFALCFENCVFPGYVTEKIFDSIAAGCIPIYFGAPDIETFVPSDCYVNFRDVSSLRELRRLMREMAASEAQRFLDRGREFLNSEDGRRFRPETFAEELLELAEDICGSA